MLHAKSFDETSGKTENDNHYKTKSSSSPGDAEAKLMKKLSPEGESKKAVKQQGNKNGVSDSVIEKDKATFNSTSTSTSGDKENPGFTVKISLAGKACSDEVNSHGSRMGVETIVFPSDKETQSHQKLSDKKNFDGAGKTEDVGSLGTKITNVSTEGDNVKKDDDVAFENKNYAASAKEDASVDYFNTSLSTGLHSTSEKVGEEDEGPSSNSNTNSGTTTTLPSTSHTSRSSSGIVSTTTTGSGGSSIAASFLDSLSEDQRGVRTRHLPSATGFRKLHKSEIKRDIALCKAMLLQAKGKASGRSRSGSVSAAPTGGAKEESSRAKEKSKTDSEKMDIDGDNNSVLAGGGGSGEQQSISDEESTPSAPSVISGPTGGGKLSSRSSSVNSIQPLPTAFSLPYNITPSLCVDLDDKPILSATPNTITSGGDKGKAQSQSSKDRLGQQFRVFNSPQVVESITAFNPPRPPESVGPKKMHRLCRWERNPHAVESDMNTYRKTVERTRQELRKSELERERIELLGCHLRNNFLNQFGAMKEEMELLNNAHTQTQIECVKAAELLTSKTRSKGGVHAMRDAISVLKSRGTKSDIGKDVAVPMALDGEDCVGIKPWYGSGVGGVSAEPKNVSFASGWLLPGDAVTTPYGCGSVTNVFGPTKLHVGVSPLHNGVIEMRRQHGADSQDTHHGFGAPNAEKTANISGTPLTGSGENSQSKNMSRHQQSKNGLTIILPPRICVRLPFGIGFFSPSIVTIVENPSSYSDSQLATRWMAMLETAQLMGTSLDANTMGNYRNNKEKARLARKAMEKMNDDTVDENNELIDNGYDNTSMDSDKISVEIGDTAGPSRGPSDPLIDILSKTTQKAKDENPASLAKKKIESHSKTNNTQENIGETIGKLLRFGCGILPTPSYPGGALDQFSLDQLEKNIEVLINHRGGLIGKPTNPCVPRVYKQWEKQRYEVNTLEGKVLQLRNEVHRQSRFRRLNERSRETCKDRRDRFEVLLVEMKADLNSLKERLNEELVELGIDEEKAEELLVEYNTQAQEQEQDLDREGYKYDAHQDAPPKRKKDQYQTKSSRQKLEPLGWN